MKEISEFKVDSATGDSQIDSLLRIGIRRNMGFVNINKNGYSHHRSLREGQRRQSQSQVKIQ